MPETDNVLVKKAQEGNKQAAEELIVRYKNLVRSIARGYILPGGETEDLIQEGMIGFYRAIYDYNINDELEKENKSKNSGILSFKNFACICVKRRIFDAIKKSNRKKNQPMNNYVPIFGAEEIECESPEEEVIRSESREEFVSIISRVLSVFEFRVMVMYMEGFSTSEICDAIAKDEKSVDNAIQRSKRKLEKEFTSQKK